MGPQKRAAAAAIVVALSGFGCSTPELSQREYLHMLCVDVEGRAASVRVGDQDLAETAHGLEVQVREVAQAVKDAVAGGKKGVVFVIHGGLVSMDGAIASSRAALSEMEKGDLYPVFVNWETGMFTSYANWLFGVRLGKEEHWGGALSSPAYILAELVRAIGRLPITYFYQTYRALRPTGIRDVPPDWTERAVLVHEPFDRPSFLARMGAHVNRVIPGAARLVTTPGVDAIGAPAYRNMLRRAGLLFERDRDFVRAERGQEATATGGLALLMDELRPLFDDDFRIEILAHSLGTLVANELVHRYPDAPFREIVYMGAACTIADFARTTLVYVKQNEESRFYNLTLHPKEESDDRYAWGAVPHGSLLVWIDGFVTQQRSHLDRTLGAWNNVVPALPLLGIDPETARRITVKGFGRSGASPNDHDQLNDAKYGFWTREFRELPE